MNQRDQIRGTAAWIAEHSGDEASVHVPLSEAFDGGRLLLSQLATNAVPAATIDSLHAAVELLGEEEPPRYEIAVALQQLIAAQISGDPEEIGEVLIESMFHCWRLARSLGAWEEASLWRGRMREVSDRTSPVRDRIADFVLGGHRESLDLFSNAELLIASDQISEVLDRSPTIARQLSSSSHLALAEPGSRDCEESRHYTDFLMGNFALIAGTACRQLNLGDEARSWFDTAESAFRDSGDADSDLARLSYQRLALRTTNREMEVVLEAAPHLVRRFRELGMREDELKAQFLEGLAFMETGRVTEAAELFEEVCRIAKDGDLGQVLAQASVNLTHIYGMLGDARKAIAASQQAIPALQATGDRIGLAKANWGIAILLRQTGQLDLSVEAHRAAQAQFEEIGMHADAAALHLAIADIRLDQGREDEALRCVLAALPIIDELEMVPEGMAAMALLRESVSRQRVSQRALREIHGYFDELKNR